MFCWVRAWTRAHRGGRGQSFVYELVFARQADSGKPTLHGLIEIGKLGIDKLKE